MIYRNCKNTITLLDKSNYKPAQTSKQILLLPSALRVEYSPPRNNQYIFSGLYYTLFKKFVWGYHEGWVYDSHKPVYDMTLS